MTSVEEIRAQFDAVHKNFEIKEGQPTKNYITKIVEEPSGTIFTICSALEKVKDNLIGIIISDAEYNKRYGRTFRRSARPGVYDSALSDDKVTVPIRKAEVV